MLASKKNAVNIVQLYMHQNLRNMLQILSDGKHHSEALLGNKLELTRSAIWKLVKQLKRYGIDITTSTNLGYKIPGGLELLNKKDIAAHLSQEFDDYNNKIIVHDSLPSTNSYLAELIKTNGYENSICFAEHQTAGKGRLGRNWISPYAKSIYLSLAWQFSKSPYELSGLGLVMAIATVTALKTCGIEKDIALKWPNDVLWRKKKLGGILVELFGEAPHIYHAIIGVGLNVNIPQGAGKKITQPWCDITQITNSSFSRNKLAGVLLNQLLMSLANYQNTGLKPFIKKWHKLDASYGKKVTIITPQQTVSGIGAGIDDNGYFLLEDKQKTIHAFASAEVSLSI